MCLYFTLCIYTQCSAECLSVLAMSFPINEWAVLISYHLEGHEHWEILATILQLSGFCKHA